MPIYKTKDQKAYNKKLMTFKQKCIHEAGPFPFDFEKEKRENFSKIISLLHEMDRNMWTVSAFNFGSMIENYKTVYGLTTHELETLISLLSNIFYEEKESSVEPRIIILKLLNRLLDEQIEISDNFRISNQKLMEIVMDRIKNGTKDPLKHQDGYMEELSKFILAIAKYGQDLTKEATNKAIEFKQTRILALFILSVKTQERAQQLIDELLKDSSIWERDISWYFIISEVAKKFPKLDFSSHYATLFQEVIKIFTNMLDPVSNQELKKLTEAEPCIGIRSILKSIACLLVNLLLPNSYPQSNYVWNAVERIFNIITTTLDYINQPPFIMEELQFMRAFVKYFLLRFRKERNIYLEKNQDFIEDFHGQPEKELFVDTWLHNNFNSLWPEIIPKILYYEENQSMAAKIIVDLAMFDHQFFMPLILNAVKNVLQRQDLTMISLYSSKMSLLFLYDFIFKDQKQYISEFLQIFKILLQIVEKLGISQNLDILQLVLRSFIYMDQEVLDSSQTEGIIQDALQIILKNLDTMSISLEENQNDQSELYIDLANIYFPFFVRLNKNVIDKFMDKFAFKLLNELPEHTEAYQLLSIICSYIEPKFTERIFKQFYTRMIGIEEPTSNSKPKKGAKHHHDKPQHKKTVDKSSYFFFENIKESLLTKNENQIKWYCEIIQCLYQYHPQNIVRDFPQLQKILICLMKEWDNTTFSEISLDIIFNIILCLSHVHFDWTEFNKPQNSDYRTLKINWKRTSQQSLELLLYIYDKYFVKLIDFMKNRYGAKAQQILDSKIVQYTTNGVSHEIKSSELKLIENVLLPQPNEELEISEEKKLIYKVFSLQYTVLSALMTRCQFFVGAHALNQSFINHPTLNQIRKVAVQYGEWVCDLLQSYKMLWEPTNLKLFNFFRREAMDEVFFTTPLQATAEKLSPYYYSQIYRKKQLLRSSFLILNEAYVLFITRMQFLLEVNPVASMNHPDYLKKQYILGLHPQFDSALRSYVPPSANIHKYHKHIMLLCRYHMDPSNKDSLSYRYMNTTEKRMKEKYLLALKMILANIKKSQNPINYECCIKDEFILDSLLSCVQLFKVFEAKQDKMVVIDLFYMMMIFGYDCNLLGENKKTDLKRMIETFNSWSLTNSQKDLNNSTSSSYNQPYLCMMNKVTDVEISERSDGQQKMVEQINLKLKRTSSFRSPGTISVQVTAKLQKLIEHILQKLNVDKSQLDKDSILYCVVMIMFSKYLLLSNPIFGKIIMTLIELTKSGITELFDVSKVGLFHIINRFNSLKKVTTKVPNTIVKRSFSDFLIFRYLGGNPPSLTDTEYYTKVFIDKNSNYFYPSEELEFYEYESLGDDPDSDAKQNQEVMLRFLTSHEELTKFILSCSHDKDLKEQQTEIDTSIFTDESTMGIAANGHKILNFILDSNPKKNNIFAPFIQNFTIYPISFYPRMLRKLIRMGNQSTIDNLIKIAEELRLSNQIQQKKMALYISCEIVFVVPIQNPFTQKFIQYLATCSNDVYDFSTQCIFLMFTKNFVTSRKIYEAFIKRFREEKGSSRLRHLTLMNLFIMAQGRFARPVAIQGIQHLLKGIEEGSNEVSQVIITMIVSCFVIAINMKEIAPWILESPLMLMQEKKFYKLNDWVGYEIDDSLRDILADIVAKTKAEKNMESKNLKTYSKIANKILASISVYRYNDSFYEVLRDLIFYVIQKTPEEGETDQQIILQLRDSEYPQNIYYDLINNIKNMTDNPPSVVRKKLMLIESLVINYCYSMNKIEVPDDILKINEKSLTLEFIVCVSNMYRLLTRAQTINKVQQQMAKGKNKNLYKLMALLLSTGVREYEWKEEVLKEILIHKKQKIVKEFISYWWKGKTPETEEEKRLQHLVQNVENPYSYFA